MREASNLKFNPIKFTGYGINGSPGDKSPDDFFRSVLPQNICYAVRNEWKTVNEIADDLGVSPVFVDGEVQFLEEYGFLEKQKNRYRINFLLEERTTELLKAEDAAYKAAAALYASKVYLSTFVYTCMFSASSSTVSPLATTPSATPVSRIAAASGSEESQIYQKGAMPFWIMSEAV